MRAEPGFFFYQFECVGVCRVEGCEPQPNEHMKKLLVLFIAVAATVGFSPQAEARGHRGPSRHYVEYHHTCRGPAWVETYIAYYDCHGHPVFRTRVVPVRRVVRPAACHSVRTVRPARYHRVERAPRRVCHPRTGVRVTLSAWR